MNQCGWTSIEHIWDVHRGVGFDPDTEEALMQEPEVCQDAAHTPGWTLTYPHMCINISITMPGLRYYFGGVSEAAARGQSPALNLLGIAWEEFLKTPTAPDQLLIKLKKNQGKASI